LPGDNRYTQTIGRAAATNHFYSIDGHPQGPDGALKHFFDIVYYPSLDHVAGRPYGLWVHGNNDTVGAANAVDKVATGLSLTKAADVLEIVGAVDANARERAYELGGTLAAVLME
jgi:hypothetical protein